MEYVAGILALVGIGIFIGYRSLSSTKKDLEHVIKNARLDQKADDQKELIDELEKDLEDLEKGIGQASRRDVEDFWKKRDEK